MQSFECSVRVKNDLSVLEKDHEENARDMLFWITVLERYTSIVLYQEYPYELSKSDKNLFENINENSM